MTVRSRQVWGDWKRALLAVSILLGGAFGVAQSGARNDAIVLEQQGRNSEASQAWKSITEADPTNAEAFAHLGLLESRQEDYANAIVNYRKALALNPAMPGLELNLGLALFKASQFPDAIKMFRAQLDGLPAESAEARRLVTLLGMAHYGMGDYFVAIPYLRRAADDDPQSLPVRLTLAHSCLWSKQYDCVQEAYKEILALNAGSAEADMIAGEALDEKGDDAGAMEQFRAAVAANPQEPDAHFGLGYLLWKQHHFEEAAVEFRAELGNDPSQFLSRAYLGDAMVELNDYEKAQPELEKAAGTSSGAPALAMVHRDLGVVYGEEGRKDEAVKEFRQAIALDPNDVSPHWRLGKLYKSMGRQDEAKAELEAASAMNKQSSRPLTQEITGNRNP